MNSKIKKRIPLIDQHDKNFMYGGKFGGNFVPETLKKPIDDLAKLFTKLRKRKKHVQTLLLSASLPKSKTAFHKTQKKGKKSVQTLFLGVSLPISQPTSSQ